MKPAERLTTETYWDDHWQKAVARPKPFTGYDERVWRAIFARTFAGAKAGQSCVEVGCADSRFLPYIAQHHGLTVAGLDYSETGCKLVRERLQRAGIEGRIWQRDIFQPNEDLAGRFDYVVSFGLVEHFRDPITILKPMRRLLKPTGCILTTTPNVTPRSLNVRIQRILSPAILGLHKLMTADELRRYHEQSGFQTIEAGYEGMGLNLECDHPGWWRRALLTGSYRSVQALRRSFELLHLTPPHSGFTGVFMVYRGKV